MIAIIPSASRTYEIFGPFESDTLIDGKLYYDKDGRLYFYSKTLKRSNPETGYFPVWDGTHKYETRYSNKKYLSDAVNPNIGKLSDSVTGDIAKEIRFKLNLPENDEILKPRISNEDNMFTQCVKGSIYKMNIGIGWLYSNGEGVLSEHQINNYYASLNKVTMMRLEKFHIWIDVLLKLHYEVLVKKSKRQILSYKWPENKFDTGIVKYNDIVKTISDPFKKIVRILMVMNNISKSTLKKDDDVDDYTINNMMTTLLSSKPLSAQIFCRFMRMSELPFVLNIYQQEDLLFTYKE